MLPEIGAFLSVNELRKLLLAVAKHFWDLRRRGAPRRLSEDLSEEYWRLFGASAVPQLMELFEGFQILEDEHPMEDYHKIRTNRRDFHLTNKMQMDVFKRIAKKRNLTPSNRLLWERYSGNTDNGVQADFLAKSSAPNEVAQWLSDNYLDEDGHIFWPEGTECRSGDKANLDGETGFLFFVLKNISKKPIKNLEICFQKASVRQTLPTQRWDGDIPDFEAALFQFKSKGEPQKYLSKTVEFPETEAFIINLIEPKQEFLFLLSVYRSDVQGFENGFVDDVFKPKHIFRNDVPGSRPLQLREPLREKSTRIIVPYGWFQQ